MDDSPFDRIFEAAGWLPAWERTRRLLTGRAMRWSLATAAVLGLGIAAWRLMPQRDEGFFRAGTSPAPVAPALAPAADPTDRMMVPLPGATVEVAVARARAQIARGALVAPPDDKGLPTLVAALNV